MVITSMRHGFQGSQIVDFVFPSLLSLDFACIIKKFKADR
jgi:hypothetical protein